MHIKAVADLLGHSSVAVTGDVSGHTSDDTARTAVDGLSADHGSSWSDYPDAVHTAQIVILDVAGSVPSLTPIRQAAQAGCVPMRLVRPAR